MTHYLPSYAKLMYIVGRRNEVWVDKGTRYGNSPNLNESNRHLGETSLGEPT
jgi:hypothetical protein